MSSLETVESRPGLICLPCGSRRLSSSFHLGWEGLVVEGHYAYAHEAQESYFDSYVLEVASGNRVAYGERALGRERFKPYAKPPGALNFYADGVRPAIHPTTTTDLIVCSFDPSFVTEVQEENEARDTSQLHGRFGFRDATVATIVKLLESEARDEGVTGRLYADHLIYALVARLVKNNPTVETPPPTKWTFSKLRLQRVFDRMSSDLAAPHDLQTLAYESGYSRNHFLRMFKAAAECTPHQYLLRLRIAKAETLMRNSSHELADIAAQCGFSSQAHFSRTFRRLLGVSPGEYRRLNR